MIKIIYLMIISVICFACDKKSIVVTHSLKSCPSEKFQLPQTGKYKFVEVNKLDNNFYNKCKGFKSYYVMLTQPPVKYGNKHRGVITYKLQVKINRGTTCELVSVQTFDSHAKISDDDILEIAKKYSDILPRALSLSNLVKNINKPTTIQILKSETEFSHYCN